MTPFPSHSGRKHWLSLWRFLSLSQVRDSRETLPEHFGHKWFTTSSLAINGSSEVRRKDVGHNRDNQTDRFRQTDKQTIRQTETDRPVILMSRLRVLSSTSSKNIFGAAALLHTLVQFSHPPIPSRLHSHPPKPRDLVANESRNENCKYFACNVDRSRPRNKKTNRCPRHLFGGIYKDQERHVYKCVVLRTSPPLFANDFFSTKGNVGYTYNGL